MNNRIGTQQNTATEHFRSVANRIGTEQAPKGGCSSVAAIAPASTTEQETYLFRCNIRNRQLQLPLIDGNESKAERCRRLLGPVPKPTTAAKRFDRRAYRDATAIARKGLIDEL